MTRGRRSRTLTLSQIYRLETFRRRGDQDHPHGYTYPQLKLSMNGRFSFATFMRAMDRKPILELYHAYIVEWLDRFVPERPIVDGKAAACGRDGNGEDAETAIREEQAGRQDAGMAKDELDKEAPAPVRTVRGSR
jgi:hypothetical protein